MRGLYQSDHQSETSTSFPSIPEEMLGMERNCGMDGVEGRDGTCVGALSPHFRTRVVRCYSHCFTDGCNGYTSLFHFLNLHKRKRDFIYDYPLPWRSEKDMVLFLNTLEIQLAISRDFIYGFSMLRIDIKIIFSNGKKICICIWDYFLDNFWILCRRGLKQTTNKTCHDVIISLLVSDTGSNERRCSTYTCVVLLR